MYISSVLVVGLAFLLVGDVFGQRAPSNFQFGKAPSNFQLGKAPSNFQLGKAQSNFQLGKPNFDLQGAGGGKNFRNFQAGFNGGVSSKVWENKKRNQNLELGVKYGQSFLRHQGQTFKSQPTYGVGATFRFRK